MSTATQRALCAFKGCFNSKCKNPDLKFHRFPRNHRRRAMWILRSGNTDLRKISNKQMDNGKRLCSLHFKKEDYQPSPRNHLLKDQVLPEFYEKVDLDDDTYNAEVESIVAEMSMNRKTINYSSDAISLPDESSNDKTESELIDIPSFNDDCDFLKNILVNDEPRNESFRYSTSFMPNLNDNNPVKNVIRMRIDSISNNGNKAYLKLDESSNDESSKKSFTMQDCMDNEVSSIATFEDFSECNNCKETINILKKEVNDLKIELELALKEKSKKIKCMKEAALMKDRIFKSRISKYQDLLKIACRKTSQLNAEIKRLQKRTI